MCWVDSSDMLHWNSRHSDEQRVCNQKMHKRAEKRLPLEAHSMCGPVCASLIECHGPHLVYVAMAARRLQASFEHRRRCRVMATLTQTLMPVAVAHTPWLTIFRELVRISSITTRWRCCDVQHTHTCCAISE